MLVVVILRLKLSDLRESIKIRSLSKKRWEFLQFIKNANKLKTIRSF